MLTVNDLIILQLDKSKCLFSRSTPQKLTESSIYHFRKSPTDLTPDILKKQLFCILPNVKILAILTWTFNWGRKWQPTPVLLPGESHGRRSLVGYSPWCCKELDTTEWLHFHFQGHIIQKTRKNPEFCQEMKMVKI